MLVFVFFIYFVCIYLCLCMFDCYLQLKSIFTCVCCHKRQQTLEKNPTAEINSLHTQIKAPKIVENQFSCTLI